MANERRLIDIAPYENMVDATVCQIQVYRSGDGYCDVMNFKTENIPTVDAIIPVRCKDCAYTRPLNDTEALMWLDECKVCYNGDANESGYNIVMPEHFCSYGERKSGTQPQEDV